MNVGEEHASGHHDGTRLRTTIWIIDARWYYTSLAFLLGLVAGKEPSVVPYAELVLPVLLLLVFLCNGVFYYVLHKTAVPKSAARMRSLNITQIALDLIFFFIVMLITGGGIASVAHSFFFVPIIVSTIIFGFQGAIVVAILSAFLLVLSVVADAGILGSLLMPEASLPVFSPELSLLLTQSAIITVIYLMTAFFGGYLAKLLHARDLMLLEEIRKGEEHVARLEELTREFDKSAKLLVRRDLELTNANQKLTQLDRLKSEIISIAAHQLRTPLSAIKWTLKVLVDGDAGPVTPAQRELLMKGFESNERMIGLVNDMLEVDRLESGKIAYTFVPVAFDELVRNMIASLLPLATQKSVRVEFLAPPTPIEKIKVDPDKMRDVLQNLIDNAIKYTKENGVVTIGLGTTGTELHFWVKDTGIGIPDADKDKIFSRFFRAQNAVHSQTSGSGLGLFIVQSIVRRHGGKVWFESEENIGTTFHVLLPYSA